MNQDEDLDDICNLLNGLDELETKLLALVQPTPKSIEECSQILNTSKTDIMNCVDISKKLKYSTVSNYKKLTKLLGEIFITPA
jgi:hypothetical protein